MISLGNIPFVASTSPLSVGEVCRGESVRRTTDRVKERILVTLRLPFPKAGTPDCDRVIRVSRDLNTSRFGHLEQARKMPKTGHQGVWNGRFSQQSELSSR